MGVTKPKPTEFPGKVKKTNKEVVTEPELTDKQVEWLRKYYPTASVKELLSAMNVSLPALYKIRDKYGLKKDPEHIRKQKLEANKRMLESIRENGRISSPRPGSVHVRTKQKGPFVVIATKVCKADYDEFTNLVTLQGLTKHEVMRSLVKDYIHNTKITHTKAITNLTNKGEVDMEMQQVAEQ